MIQNPDVQAALSTFIVSAIYDNVDVEAELADRLPPRMRVVFSPSVDDAKSGGGR